MKERRRFKFQSSKKKLKLLNAVPFDEILSFRVPDSPGEQGCFISNLRNVLRCKDLKKHSNDMKGLLDGYCAAVKYPWKDEASFLEWTRDVVETLLRCAKTSNAIEIRIIFKLFSALYKDFGEKENVTLPYGALLSLAENNPDLNAEHIFSFFATFFRTNTSSLFLDLSTFLGNFMPWIEHRNGLIKNLSMDSLGNLLRRSPDEILQRALSLLMHLDGAERIVFAIIKNIDGTFTSRMPFVFISIFCNITSLDLKSFENGGSVVVFSKIANTVRLCFDMMAHHCKDSAIRLDWLEPVYGNNMKNIVLDTLPATSFIKSCVVSELCIEMFVRFANTEKLSLKDWPLVNGVEHFDILLPNFVIPLLSFYKRYPTRGGPIFEDLCRILVETINSSAEAANVLSRSFDEFLVSLDITGENDSDLNSLMSVFEWRFNSGNIMDISHVLLYINRMFHSRATFHPFFVNQSVVEKILFCISITIGHDLPGKNESLQWDKMPTSSFAPVEFFDFQDKMTILFGCLSGIKCLSDIRKKLGASPIVIESSIFESVLLECSNSFKFGNETMLTVELFILCYELIMTKDKHKWIELLIELIGNRNEMLLYWRLVELLHLNFVPSAEKLIPCVVENLPSANTNLRCHSIVLVETHLKVNRNIECSSVRDLLDMERLDNSLENERRKALLMMKSVEGLNMDSIGNDNLYIIVSLISNILESQYFIKFASLWSAAYDAHLKLINTIVSSLTGERSLVCDRLLDYMWNHCLLQLYSVKNPKVFIFQGPQKLVREFIKDDTYEQTDAATIQCEFLRLISEIVNYSRDRHGKVELLVKYLREQLTEENNKDFQRDAIASVSKLLQKHKICVNDQELINLCLRDGIRSADAHIREHSLAIISTIYPKINLKKLRHMASGTHKQILISINGCIEDGYCDKNKELSIAIEIRILAPKILQYSNCPHGKSLVDYFAKFDAKYINLLIMELLPSFLCDVFSAEIKSDCHTENYGYTDPDSFNWMVNLMHFKGNLRYNQNLQRTLAAISLLIARLKRHLSPQAPILMECLCRLLKMCLIDDYKHIAEEVKIEEYERYFENFACRKRIANRTIKILILLVEIFEDKRDQFIKTLEKYSSVIISLFNVTSLAFSFVLCWTSKMDWIVKFCTGVLQDFRDMFNRPMTKRILGIAANIYSDYPDSLGNDINSIDCGMLRLMVSAAEALLESLKQITTSSSSLIMRILQLPIPIEIKRTVLIVLLDNLPTPHMLNNHKLRDAMLHDNSFKELKNLLFFLHSSVAIIDSHDFYHVELVWKFINDCIGSVGDAECRRLASSLLALLPVAEEGIDYISELLVRMNSTKHRDIASALDLDLNAELLSELISELKDRKISSRCLHTILIHSFYLVWHNQKDLGINRYVALLTQSIMDVISNSLLIEISSISSDSTEDKITEECVKKGEGLPSFFILKKCIFPFVLRCFGSKGSEEYLIRFSLELLEQFSRIFGSKFELRSHFKTKLYGDLLGNADIVDCFYNLRHLQKHRRYKGLKQLRSLIDSGTVFSKYSIYKLIIPYCLQSLLRSQSSKNVAFLNITKECLICASKALSKMMLLKFLTKLVDIFCRYKFGVALSVFSSILQNCNAMDMQRSDLYCGSTNSEARLADSHSELYDSLLSKLKKKLIKEQSKKGDDIPHPEVFEAIGSLLKHYAGDKSAREISKLAKILSKPLGSRCRDSRRSSRISIVKLLKATGLPSFVPVLRELSSILTKGFQLSVLTFTTYSILSSIFKNHPDEVLSTKDEIHKVLELVAQEILRVHGRDTSSKMDEERYPRASDLIRLICKYSDFDVGQLVWSFLIFILDGSLNVVIDGNEFGYSSKLLGCVEHLIATATLGFMENRNINLFSLSNVLFFTTLTYIHDMYEDIRKIIPEDLIAEFNYAVAAARSKFRQGSFNMVQHDNVKISMRNGTIRGPIINGEKKGKGEVSIKSKKSEYYELHLDGPAGAPLKASENVGLDRHIIAPLFVNAALRIFNHILSLPGNVFTKDERKRGATLGVSSEGLNIGKEVDEETVFSENVNITKLGILLCFVSKDLKLQRASANCLLRLCKCDMEFIYKTRNTFIASLMDRFKALQFIGSEDLAKDYVRLMCILLRSRFRNLLYEVWENNNRTTGLIETLLSQIEMNLGRPQLQKSLLNLLAVLQTEDSISDSNKEQIHEISNVVLLRMLKGNLTGSAQSIAPGVVAKFFLLIPMTEANRSKIFGTLIKHLNAPDHSVRLAVLQTIHILLKDLPLQLLWRRYGFLIGISIVAKLLTHDYEMCRHKMMQLISLLWKSGSNENKNDLVRCIAHFLKKNEKYKDTTFSYFAFCCLSQESSIQSITKLNILETAVYFMGSLDEKYSVKANTTSLIWQQQYYWIRSLEHLFTIDHKLECIPKKSSTVLSGYTLEKLFGPVMKIWSYVVNFAISSEYPWIRAASLRTLSLVLSNQTAVENLFDNFENDIFSLIRPCFKVFSIEMNMMERHKKVEDASKDVITKLINLAATFHRKSEQRIPKIISKLCYILRRNLWRRSECQKRIQGILEVIGSFVKKEVAYKLEFRQTLLRVMIVIFRVANCKEQTRAHWRRHRSPKTSTANNELAQSVLSTIESTFYSKEEATEYLKLLSFARNFVLRSLMAKKRLIRQTLVTNQKKAALRKIMKHERIKRSHKNRVKLRVSDKK